MFIGSNSWPVGYFHMDSDNPNALCDQDSNFPEADHLEAQSEKNYLTLDLTQTDEVFEGIHEAAVTYEECASLSPRDSILPKAAKKTLDDGKPKNKLTQKQTTWCLRIWSEWAIARNSNLREGENPFSKNFEELSVTEMQFWLCRFILEVRKHNGEPYPPSSLYQLCCGLQRKCRESGRGDIKLFEGPRFHSFQTALDGEVKRLNASGDYQTRRQAQPITSEEENQLWEVGLLGDHSPQVLVNTMVWQIGLHFGIRSGNEHRSLRYYPSQITLIEPSDGRAHLVYKEDVATTDKGNCQNRRKRPKQLVCYANESDPARCFVRLYKLYNSKCRSDRPASAFYLQPLPKPTGSFWYSRNPIGHNQLHAVVSKLMKEAGFEGYYTSNSLRVSAANRVFECVDDQMIQLLMTPTGSTEEGRGFKRTMEQRDIAGSVDHENAEKRAKVREEPEFSIEDYVQANLESSVEDSVVQEELQPETSMDQNLQNIVQDNAQLTQVPNRATPADDTSPVKQVFQVSGGSVTVNNNYFHHKLAPSPNETTPAENAPSEQVFQVSGGTVVVNNSIFS